MKLRYFSLTVIDHRKAADWMTLHSADGWTLVSVVHTGDAYAMFFSKPVEGQFDD